MRWAILLVLLGTACSRSVPPGLSDWQAAFFETTPTADWGYRDHSDYRALGDTRALTDASLKELRSLLSRPAGEGPFKCLVHVDGRLVAGRVTAEVCTGCGIFLVDKKEWSIGDRERLKTLLVGTLGERPREPGNPNYELY